MKLEFEYGQGTMAAELPDNTDIFIPGETVKDPDYIPEDKLRDAYLTSLAHPIGMPTLTELAHKGSTVTFVVPDRVKGGDQPQKTEYQIYFGRTLCSRCGKERYFIHYLKRSAPKK